MVSKALLELLAKNKSSVAPVPAPVPIPIVQEKEKIEVIKSTLPEFKESGNLEADYIRRQIYELRMQLDNNIPGFATVLSDIRNKLKADAAVVTILSMEEIKTIVDGAKKHALIEVIAPKELKESKRAVKKGITANDL